MAQFRRTAWGGALVLATTLLAGAGWAQTVPAEPPPPSLGPTLSSPFDVSTCLCLERSIETRSAELTVRRNAYEELAREIQDAEAAIDRQRPLVDVNNSAAIDDFKRRLDQLDVMKTRQEQVTLPDYQAAVASYNDRVAQYTQRCSGHELDPAVSEQMRATLVCQPDQ
jgi:hypothetical protein